MKLTVLTFICALLAHSALAIGIDTPLASSSQEAQAQKLFTELRCIVCAGQTLADSEVSLARDMRLQVRTMIHAGASDDAILTYFVERYGQEVLTSPPTKGAVAFLWVLPIFILLIACLFLYASLRAQKEKSY